MSKHCDYHYDERRRLLRRVFAGILSFILLILFIIFLVWIILRPTKPRFILQEATVFAFNISSSTNDNPSPTIPTPSTLSLTMQVTLSAINPNSQIGIYYQKLDAYASYRGQQISLATGLPPTYQGHREVTVFSPLLYGTAVPVSSYLTEVLRQDQNTGGVLVNVKVNGRVKWKVGTWISGRYHIYVNCPAYIKLAGDRDDDNSFGISGPAVKFQFVQSCIVDV